MPINSMSERSQSCPFSSVRLSPRGTDTLWLSSGAIEWRYSAAERPWHRALRLFRRPEAGRTARAARHPTRSSDSKTGPCSPATGPRLRTRPPTEIQTMELLTNGTVMAATYSDAWYLLTPSSTGSYVNGTWSELARRADPALVLRLERDAERQRLRRGRRIHRRSEGNADRNQYRRDL